jgi:hypothetical protein
MFAFSDTGADTSYSRDRCRPEGDQDSEREGDGCRELRERLGADRRGDGNGERERE